MMEASISDTIHSLQRLLFTGMQGDSSDRPQPLFTSPSPFLPALCPSGLAAGALPGSVQGWGCPGFLSCISLSFF